MTSLPVTWSAPEFEYREKSVSWYWGSIAVMTLFLGIAVWQRNFLFGVFLVIAEILLIVWGNKEPRTVEYAVADDGIHIKGYKTYAAQDIESFGVNERADSPWNELLLEAKGKFKPRLRIYIPKSRTAEITDACIRILGDPTPMERSFIDALQQFLRF